MAPVYFFFAPPRAGNHWVELMLAGLYYNHPVFLLDQDGRPRSDLEKRYGTTDIASILAQLNTPDVPPVTPENPILFLEHEQNITQELVARGDEINLPVVRSLVSAAERGVNSPVLRTQWFHGAYHAPPFWDELPPAIEGRYLFLCRAPQAMAYSYYKVWTNRWARDDTEIERNRKGFLDYYTQRFLEDTFTFFEAYEKIACRRSAFIFRYEDLLESPSPLVDFATSWIGGPPKLSPELVWRAANFKMLARTDRIRTFYRSGKANSWLQELSKKELNTMMRLEREFDFERIGYRSTQHLMDDARPDRWRALQRMVGGR